MKFKFIKTSYITDRFSIKEITTLEELFEFIDKIGRVIIYETEYPSKKENKDGIKYTIEDYDDYRE